MSYEEIKEMLESFGLPYNYYQWEEEGDNEPPELPYILFYYPERNDFNADDRNYVKIARLNIELYSEEKDFEHESMIEDILEERELVYTKEEQYIADERMYETLYTMEVNIK